MIRYRVIAEAHDEQLTPAETGLPVRGLAGRGYELPGGMRKEFSRASLDQWIRAYREAGHRLGRPKTDAARYPLRVSAGAIAGQHRDTCVLQQNASNSVHTPTGERVASLPCR